MGLGALITITLWEAREKATEARRLLVEGKDPLEAKRASRAAAAKGMTFDACAEQFVKAHAAGWHPSHAQQWAQSVSTYASPIVGGMDVKAITTEHVMRILGDFWKEKPETASRLRGRIESILDWARVRGYRDGDNPARWRGHLDHLLPAPRKVRKVEHYPALPYAEIGGFMNLLRQREGAANRALEFLILTATRTAETLGARWDEIDLGQKLWVLSPGRTKAAREHRIPLADRALKILAEMSSIRDSDFVFAGRRGRLGKGALEKALLRLRENVTPHGFRSSFRDWAGDHGYPRELAEQALAHAIGDKSEQAYRRGDALERRRAMMDAWASYCDQPSAGRDGKVVTLNKKSVREAR
jgi:integrase